MKQRYPSLREVSTPWSVVMVMKSESVVAHDEMQEGERQLIPFYAPSSSFSSFSSVESKGVFFERTKSADKQKN